MDGGLSHQLSDMCTIGRHPANLVVVADPSVSSHHAELVRTPHGRYLLRDLCTRSGTFVGDERIVERFLVDGDLVRVGQVHLRFEERPVRLVGARRRATQMSSPPPA